MYNKEPRNIDQSEEVWLQSEADNYAEDLEPSEKLLSLQEMLRYIKNTESYKQNKEEYIDVCKKMYSDMTNFVIENGGEFVTDVNQIYREFGGSNAAPLIIRKEDPEKVLALSEGFDINLSFDPKVSGVNDEKYINCAIWPYGTNYVSGIATAFREGRGMAGPIAMLIGVKQNINNNKVEKADIIEFTPGKASREAVRIASGALKKEDLQFVIFRFQKDFFPAENLVDSERADDVTQIFRSFKF